MHQGASKVRVNFTAASLTHFGGVYLVHQFLQQLRFRSFLYNNIPFKQRNSRYTLSELIVAHLYPMILGLEKIEVTALLKTNGVFQYLTGLPSFPHPTTLRRFLLRADILPEICSTHNILRAKFITLPTIRSSFWLDFDSTVKTLYGNQEGVVKGYNPQHKGKKSYHPLICTEAHLQDCLGGELRYGNTHTADGVEEMLDQSLTALPHRQRLRVRADAGFYDGDFVAKLGENKADFIIVAPMSHLMKQRLPGLRYQRVNDLISVTEFDYQPHKWKEECRFVVSREKLTEKRKAQLNLFTVDAYAYRMMVTNLLLTPQGVFTFYKGHSGIERIVRILRDDYPFGSAPTKSFPANALYAELSLLAYNLMIWFKRLCLPEEWQTYTVETLRHRLLLIPGLFTKTDNRSTLKLPKNNPYKEIFLCAQERIKRLKPLV